MCLQLLQFLDKLVPADIAALLSSSKGASDSAFMIYEACASAIAHKRLCSRVWSPLELLTVASSSWICRRRAFSWVSQVVNGMHHPRTSQRRLSDDIPSKLSR